ncbi:MAG: hypothetical protein GXP30_02300 [Verrucomicrobia bacterium]|nr:hypothetical protein [Verrucomicrobiota bacterium]
MAGIPGPLKGAGPVTRATSLQVDTLGFTSLDELEPEPEPRIDKNTETTQSFTQPSVEQAEIRRASAPSDCNGVCEAGITLRAIFASSEAFTLERIAALTVKLPGITSCFIKSSEHAVLATREQETVRSVEAVTDFPQIESFQSVCDLLKVGKMSGLMIRSQGEPIYCFASAGVSLVSRHSGENLEPGLWEKLTLITQSVAEMNLAD